MKNIGCLTDCYGCTVCGGVCPVNIIDIKEKEGFLVPNIKDNNLCINCGICMKTCSFFNKEIMLNQTLKEIEYKFYSVVSNNKNILKTTTSGGLVYEILKCGMNLGYNIIGVVYDPHKQKPIHLKINEEGDLIKTKGSKYLQSDLSNEIKNLSKDFKYIVVGTPCQISSLNNYLELKGIRRNFLLIDFFCHGIPDLRMWKLYLKLFDKITGEIQDVSFRPKDFGWHDSLRVKLIGRKGQHIEPPQKNDLFFSFFLGDRCLQKSCYDSCIFKQLNSKADLRVGDLWGKTYENNNTGVSGLVVMTTKGDTFIKNNLKNVTINMIEPYMILDGQMKFNAKRPISYGITKFGLRNSFNLKLLGHICHFMERTYHIPAFLKRKFMN